MKLIAYLLKLVLDFCISGLYKGTHRGDVFKIANNKNKEFSYVSEPQDFNSYGESD